MARSQTSKTKLNKLLLGEGADLVGTASVDRFEEALPGCKPIDILPDARTVVAIALRVSKGALKSGNPRLITNDWNAVNAEINRICLKGAVFLEDQGYQAAVIPPFLPLEILERHGLAGDLSLKHAAAMAGIGVIGNSGLLITPRFGPRQRLGALITDAPLEADPLLDEDFCFSCQEQKCISACPVGAIKAKGQLDKLRCLDRYQRFGGRALARFIKKILEAPGREERANLLKLPSVLELYELHQFMRVGGVACVECMRVCPVGNS